MNEALITEVHADVGHFPLNIEEQQIAGLQITSAYRIHCGPQLSRGSRDLYARLGVGVLNQATAVEAIWRAPPVTIRDTDLIKGNSRGMLTDGETLCRFGDHRIGATASYRQHGDC